MIPEPCRREAVEANVSPVNRILTVGALTVALSLASLSACSTDAGTAGQPASSSAPARTLATLKQALLAEKDLPSGYTVEAKADDNGATPVARSKDPKCQSFVRLINAEALPGSKASALTAFSGGPDGPFVEEWLEAMGGAAAVEKVQAEIKASVDECHEVTVSLPGAGAADMSLTAVEPPAVGAGPVAYQLAAGSGALDGFEITFVHTRVGDTLLTMDFVSIDPEAIPALMGSAHDKAARVLKISVG